MLEKLFLVFNYTINLPCSVTFEIENRIQNHMFPPSSIYIYDALQSKPFLAMVVVSQKKILLSPFYALIENKNRIGNY